MKKILLTLVAFAVALTVSGIILPRRADVAVTRDGIHKMPAKVEGAYIGTDPEYNPEGTDEAWIMNATEYDALVGESPQVGEKMTVRRSADGKTIWFRDLVPLSNYDPITGRHAWFKGEINGNDITVKAGQVMLQTANQTLYLETVEMDEAGNFKAFLPEIHFTLSDGKIEQADNNVYVAAYEDAPDISEAGFFVFINKISMQPMEDVETVTPPASAVVESWVLKHSSGSKKVSVARDGNDMYISGLSDLAPDDYVKGTVDGSTLAISAFQILTSNNRYYLRLAMADEGAPDEMGFPSFEVCTTGIFFNIVEDGKLELQSDWILSTNYDISMIMSGYRDVKLFPYAGDVAAMPSRPRIQFWSAADLLLQVVIPTEDVEGNYINQDLLSYQILFDDEIHTFTPEYYSQLTEPMKEIPYDFTDNFDIYTNGDVKTIYFHPEKRPEIIKVESIYTVNGIGYVSAPSEEVSSVDENVMEREIEGVSYVDLAGRPVENPVGGSVVIKTTRYTDGTTTVSKHIAE